MNTSFGEYIKAKRIEKGITLRDMAAKLDIAPSYMSDIEKGRRYAPDKDKLNEIAKILVIKDDELYYLFDLAGATRNSVPSDLSEFLIDNENARVLLRKVKDSNVPIDVIKEAIEKYNTDK